MAAPITAICVPSHKIMAQHVRASGSQGHVDADFTHSLACGIADQPINPDGRKDQREKGKGAQYAQEQRVSASLTFDKSRHTHHASKRQLGIHLGNDISQS